MHITAPGLDIVMSGEPREVRRILSVVTDALENRTEGRSPLSGNVPGEPSRKPRAHYSQVVLPSDLDETDSPYAVPAHEPHVRPVREDPRIEETFEIPGRNAARLRRQLHREARTGPKPTEDRRAKVSNPAVHDPAERRLDEPTSRAAIIPRAPSLALPGFDDPTMMPPSEADSDSTHERTPVDEPDPELTAVEVHPSSVPSLDRARVEITDGRLSAEGGSISDATVEAPRRMPTPREPSND